MALRSIARGSLTNPYALVFDWSLSQIRSYKNPTSTLISSNRSEIILQDVSLGPKPQAAKYSIFCYAFYIEPVDIDA